MMARLLERLRIPVRLNAGVIGALLSPLVAAVAVASADVAAVAPLAGRAPSQALTLQPYTARYQVSYRGLSGGEIEASFKHGASPDLWLYETRVFPSLLGRMAVSSNARERSSMLVTAAGVRPLAFDFNDGKADSAKDVTLRFDWNSKKATGQAEGKQVVYELVPGVQDTASVQAAMITELAAGRKPSSFTIVTGTKMRDYKYWQEGTQQVMTPYGQVEAEVWASQRQGSNRVTRTWHAPSLGFVPVQAVQYRKGNPEVQMRLVKLHRT